MTTPKIKILDPHEAIKIAAGEVIERPAHLIKELLENSIDAGAANITLYVNGAGKTLIKIVDDGSGMSPEDAQLCFAHHATSKISSVTDLDSIATYGFRGEALSSIAAVSRVELLTKTAEQKVATHIILEHGTITAQQQAAHPTGTTFIITQLFAKIPARQKFLKSDDTEWNAIVTIFQAFCLRYLNITFKLFHNDFMAYHCHATEDIKVRCAQLFNTNIHTQLIPLPTTTEKNITVCGAISTMHYYRFNRGQMFTFVNDRWVKNSELSKAILSGYDGVLPHQKYPAAFIFINIDPQLIDVNIHPKKEEVKFLNPGIVQRIVSTAIKNALSQQINAKLENTKTAFAATPQEMVATTFTSQQHQTTVDFAPTDFSSANFDSLFDDAPKNFFNPQENATKETNKTKKIQQTVQDSGIQQSKSTSEAPVHIFQDEPTYTIIGQLKKTYILIEQEQELLMIDQHAAHERIIYQRLLQQEQSASVHLMFPHIIKLPATMLTLLMQHQKLLHDQGIIAEAFSEHELILQATPVGISQVAAEEIIHALCENLRADQNVDHLRLQEKIISTKACKAACKAGDTLDLQQMHTLIKELLATENRFSCPHGRPTMHAITFKEIEKLFKRDYVGNKQNNLNLW